MLGMGIPEGTGIPEGGRADTLEEGGCTRGWGAGLPEVLVYPRAVGYTRGWLGVPEGKVGGGYVYPLTTWTLDLGYSLPHLY